MRRSSDVLLDTMDRMVQRGGFVALIGPMLLLALACVVIEWACDKIAMVGA